MCDSQWWKCEWWVWQYSRYGLDILIEVAGRCGEYISRYKWWYRGHLTNNELLDVGTNLRESEEDDLWQNCGTKKWKNENSWGTQIKID